MIHIDQFLNISIHNTFVLYNLRNFSRTCDFPGLWKKLWKLWKKFFHESC